MKKIIVILMLALCVGVTGCANLGLTTDPSQGGLFSYNPDAYEQRLQQRRERLRELERQEIAEEQRRQNLNRSAASRRQANQDMQNKLKAVTNSSEKLRRSLDNVKTTNDEQAKALLDLQARRDRLNADIKAVETSHNMNDDEKRVEAERLKREVERLLREAEVMSNL